MFLTAQNNLEKLDEFTRPVESIMRCEDFKSNFARRLSNRYTTKSPVASLKQDTALKLPPVDRTPERPANVTMSLNGAESLEPKSANIRQNVDIPKTPDKASSKTDDIRTAEMSALTMEVETLRWQLSQTEANRQMHLALLKQIVSFLNRVKEHMVCQAQRSSSTRELATNRLQQHTPAAADLPRSRSVLHVSRNNDYSLTPNKKLGTRKISKSISNVNGLKDCATTWNASKLSLNQESDTGKKITEEISRLITLANSVLSTKLPDLSCCSEIETNVDEMNLSHIANITNDSVQTNSDPNNSLDLMGPENKSFEQSCADANIYEEVADILMPGLPSDFVSTSSLKSCGLENVFNPENIKNEIERSPVLIKNLKTGAPPIIAEKREFAHVASFIEDESGFSSMSSFQEIGIPIINIIPPTPCKEVSYPLDDLNILDSGDRWKAALDLDKQTVQVFWV